MQVHFDRVLESSISQPSKGLVISRLRLSNPNALNHAVACSTKVCVSWEIQSAASIVSRLTRTLLKAHRSILSSENCDKPIFMVLDTDWLRAFEAQGLRGSQARCIDRKLTRWLTKMDASRSAAK